MFADKNKYNPLDQYAKLNTMQENFPAFLCSLFLTSHNDFYPLRAQIRYLPNIALLQRVIQEHNYRYYIDSDPVISDQEWDVLFAYLLRSEEQAGQVFENSPTNRFANALSRQFSKGIHDEPMISLANTYNAEDLLDFNTRINNELGSSDMLSGYSVEVKLDGL